MADRKISEFTPAGDLTGDELVPIVRIGDPDPDTDNYVTTVQEIADRYTNASVLTAAKLRCRGDGFILNSSGIISVLRDSTGLYYVEVTPAFGGSPLSNPPLTFITPIPSSGDVTANSVYAVVQPTGDQIQEIRLFKRGDNTPIDCEFYLIVVPMAI